MATIDIVTTVCFRFIDCCPRDELDEVWNYDGFDPIGVLPKTIYANDPDDAFPALLLGNSGVTDESVHRALTILAVQWWQRNKHQVAELLEVGEPLWFGVASSYRLVETPWMYPRFKKNKDKRARLHVQFA